MKDKLSLLIEKSQKQHTRTSKTGKIFYAGTKVPLGKKATEGILDYVKYPGENLIYALRFRDGMIEMIEINKITGEEDRTIVRRQIKNLIKEWVS